MKHILSRVEETQPGGRRQTQMKIEVKKKKLYKGDRTGQVVAGIVRANRTPIRG